MLEAMKKQKSPGRTVYCWAQPGRVEPVMVALVMAAGPGSTISGPLRVYVKLMSGGRPYVYWSKRSGKFALPLGDGD